MFNSTLIAPTLGPEQIDVGALAESLIFYKRVYILGHRGTLRYLFNKIPPQVFLKLMQEGRLEFHFMKEQMSLARHNFYGTGDKYDIGFVSTKNLDIEKQTKEEFYLAAGTTGTAKISSSKFSKLIKAVDHVSFDKQRMIDLILANQTTNGLPIHEVITALVPGYALPSDTVFFIDRYREVLEINTNIDFTRLNQFYHRRVPSTDSSLNADLIFQLIIQAYETFYFSSSLESEVVVNKLEQAIYSSALNSVVIRQTNEPDQIQKFSEMTLDSTHAIREAINTNKVPFTELAKLLDKADRFREWLHSQPFNASIIHEFYKRSTESTWAESLPNRITRFNVFTSIGLAADMMVTGGAATAISTAAGVTDSFFIDKLINKKWEPHQFINDELAPMIRDTN